MSVDYLRSVGAEVLTVTDSEGTSDVAAVERTVRRLIEEENADFLVTCGSNRLLQLLQRLGREYKIAGEVALEQHMGGGINYRRVCWEGPVFDLQEAVTW
jgi:dihydroorotate dehydrogenase electron transfer subunit